jgi:hypothetical protein
MGEMDGCITMDAELEFVIVQAGGSFGPLVPQIRRILYHSTTSVVLVGLLLCIVSFAVSIINLRTLFSLNVHECIDIPVELRELGCHWFISATGYRISRFSYNDAPILSAATIETDRVVAS